MPFTKDINDEVQGTPDSDDPEDVDLDLEFLREASEASKSARATQKPSNLNHPPSRKSEIILPNDNPFIPISLLQKFKFLDHQNVGNLINHLAKIKLVWPEDLPGYSRADAEADPRRKEYPKSYFECSAKEKAVLLHAENFRVQFGHAYPHRRPIVIAPRNEVGVQKLFPTFLSPSTSGYSELYNAQQTALFFKDFLIPEITDQTNMPPFIRSHLTLVKERRANSFEFSLMIASFLIGAGYNAFVIDGYASKEVTTLCVMEEYVEGGGGKEVGHEKVEEPKTAGNESRSAQFDLDRLEELEYFRRIEEEAFQPPSPSKYRLIKPPEINSQYEEEMLTRANEKQLEEDKRNQIAAEIERQRTQRAPTPDPLQGLRIHSWVLLLPGRRGVTTPTFIEPFSGKMSGIDDPSFQGIEALFNHQNYYINLQESNNPIDFDLDDSTKWAKLLKDSNDKRRMNISAGGGDTQESGGASRVASAISDKPRAHDDEDSDEEMPILFRWLDFPLSWTPPIRITREDFKKRYPRGQKVFQFKDAVTESTAPYTLSDGRVWKTIKFTEETRNIRKIGNIDEKFGNRRDKLVRRLWIRRGMVQKMFGDAFPNLGPKSSIVHEFFDKGRPDSLKEHIHESGVNNPEAPRRLYYYSSTHPRNVTYREVHPKALVERFEWRGDFLKYRYVGFDGLLCSSKVDHDPGAKAKTILDLLRDEDKSMALPTMDKTFPKRKILRIVEKYERNPDKEPQEDIAEKHMLLDEGRYIILFHYGEENFTRDSLEFFKPSKNKGDAARSEFKPEDSIEFRTDPFAPPRSLYKKLLILKQLEKDTEVASQRVWGAVEEIYKSVKLRVQEDFKPKLDREFIGEKAETSQARETQMEEEAPEAVDFISPYLLKYGLPKNKVEEVNLKKKIASETRLRLIKRAKKIQDDYIKESSALKSKLAWFEGAKDRMSSKGEDEFNEEYKGSLRRMDIMEKRLDELKESAPRTYYNILMEIVRAPKLNRFARRGRREVSTTGEEPQPEDPNAGLVYREGIYKKCPNYFYKWVGKSKNDEDEEEGGQETEGDLEEGEEGDFEDVDEEETF